MVRYLHLLLFCVFASGVGAQQMSTIFSNMPDSCIPQLETAWRKDLVELYNAGKEARLENLLGGYSRLQKLTDDYLLLDLSERSSLEMKLLPLVNNTYIVCVVFTVQGPVADSHISFYTTGWEQLPSADLLTPVATGWFIREDIDRDSDAFKDATSRLDVDLVHYRLSPDAPTLTAAYTTPLYLSVTEREAVRPWLKDAPKVYNWRKSHFE